MLNIYLKRVFDKLEEIRSHGFEQLNMTYNVE